MKVLLEFEILSRPCRLATVHGTTQVLTWDDGLKSWVPHGADNLGDAVDGAVGVYEVMKQSHSRLASAARAFVEKVEDWDRRWALSGSPEVGHVHAAELAALRAELGDTE